MAACNCWGRRVRGHLIQVYTLSGFLAGAAGALSAQTTSFVDLNVLSLDLSASVLVMLVLGGLGRLYGAVVGVVFYMLVHNIAAKIDPYNWMFVIGALLIGVVLFSGGGILGLLARGARQDRGTSVMTAPVLEIKNLTKRFGSLLVTDNVSFSLPAGARHALIGPNGAGKSTLVHLLSGVLRTDSGSIASKDEG